MMSLLEAESLVCGVVFVGMLLFILRRRQRNVLREAIFDCFAKYAPERSNDVRQLNAISIDSDWVALILCGYEVETRIDKLSLEEEVRVSLVVEAVTKEAAKMVKEGFLRYYNVSFANQGKNQKINPHPPSLFLLAPKGRLEVTKRLKGRK